MTIRFLQEPHRSHIGVADILRGRLLVDSGLRMAIVVGSDDDADHGADVDFDVDAYAEDTA